MRLDLGFSFKALLIIMGCCLTYSAYNQISIRPIHALNTPLVECSGLINIDGQFVMHNDSGDGAFLYIIDTLTGNISRQIHINNAEHIDWEDICRDEQFIYIADTGNNLGVRTDLKIYKISIDSFSTHNIVQAETIHIAYADQVDFSGTNTAHNFDAETIISVGDSLYIFSKNRGDGRSKIYPVSKTPGSYTLERQYTFDAEGLITGGIYVPDSSMIVLTGYTSENPFIIQISALEEDQFSGAEFQRYEFEIDGSFQVESIAWKGGNQFISATEGNQAGGPILYCLDFDISSPSSIIKPPSPTLFFPNPCQKQFHINSPRGSTTYLYNHLGQIQLKSTDKTIDVSRLKAGSYWMQIKDRNHKIINHSILIKAN